MAACHTIRATYGDVMPSFMCTKCGCSENTALSGYWTQQMNAHERGEPFEPKCSQCNPEIGVWHGKWPRRSAAGMLAGGNNGAFIYSAVEAAGPMKHLGPFRPVVLPAGATAE
jgi:hypothetical protein